MPKGVYIRTERHRRINSDGHKGQHSSPATEFKKGHGFRESNVNWRGGKYLKQGYVIVLKPDHPFCDTRGYVFEHRLVIEQQIGRYLKPEERCHHLGAKDDNRPHMLMAFKTNGAHKQFEWDKIKPESIIYDGRKL